MKVWILTSEDPTEFTGGISRYVENITAALTAQNAEITVIARATRDYHQQVTDRFSLVGFVSDHNKGENPAESAIRSGAFPYNLLSYWPALSYQMADWVESLITRLGPPDVIECQEHGALAYFLLQRKLIGQPSLQNIPILIHCHGPSFMIAEANHQPTAAFPDYWVGEMEKFCISAADALLSPSHFVAEQIAQRTFCREKFEVIPYPRKDGIPSAPVAPSNKPTVLYFGRLEIHKGILKALQSMETLWESHADFSVVLIGSDTNYMPRATTVEAFIRARYAHQIQTGRIRIQNNCAWEELQKHIASAQIVIVPSLWENFPNTCIEAMSLRRVVLASKDGGQAELIGFDGKAGILFDWEVPGDFAAQLSQLLKMSSLEKEQMGKIARARAAEYCSKEKIVTQRLHHFENIIKRHQKPAFFPAPWTTYRLPASLQKAQKSQKAPSPKGQEPPRVSVVIPYFNLGKYVKEAVESTLHSTQLPEEILIVDDCSTGEENLTILQELESLHPSVRVIRHPTNKGLATTRNTGAQQARGEFIAFLDADDEVQPEFFEKALRVLDTYANVGFVYSWVQHFGNFTSVWPTWNAHFPYLLGHNMLCANCVVRKKAFLEVGGNNPQFEYSLEDYECWINLLKHGWLGVSLPECLVRYRMRTGSMLRLATENQLHYLYDLMVRTHPELYRQWGGELAALQAINGSSIRWDHPARNYSQSSENYLRTVEKQRDALGEEVKLLTHASKHQGDYIQKQRQEIEYLKSLVKGNPPASGIPHSTNSTRNDASYVELLKVQRDLLEGRLAVANEMLSMKQARTWEYQVAIRVVRRLCKLAPLHLILRQPLLLKTLEKFL